MGVAGEHQVDVQELTGRPWMWEESAAKRANAGRVERWLSVAAGGALAAYAIKRRTAGSAAAAVAGAALIYRGFTGMGGAQARSTQKGTGVIASRGSDTRRRLRGSRGTVVDEAVTINRPIAEVYRFWRNFENLPKFMRHLHSVAMREQGISHWVAKGPAGVKVEWDARIINEVENKLIGWQSLDGSRVATAGSVNFDETEHGTRVRVRLQYSPPGGKLGSAMAWLFGEEPTQQIHEDLRRFKALLEAGEIPTTEGQPSGRRRAGKRR